MYKLPLYVEEIIQRLELSGYKAYLVGGAVRDMVMGYIPKDYDLATDANPNEVENIFTDKKTILVGKRFGTINIVNRGKHIEVTSFRTDGEYSDGRRPEEVKFSKNLKDDLARRDFTINSLAYNPKEGIIDLFGGIKDIEDGIVRTVGEADRRFEEDRLRILRAVRFASRFGFEIEEETLNSIKKNRRGVEEVSSERIREEIFRMLVEEKPSNSIRILDRVGILELILPEVFRLKGVDQKNPNHTMDLYNHSLCVMDRTEPVIEQRLAGLLHDIGKLDTFTIDEAGVGHFYGHNTVGEDMAKLVLKRLKTSNKLIIDVSNLIHYHMNGKDNIKKPGLKRLVRKLGEENIFNLFDLQRADIICSSKREEDIKKINEREGLVREIINSKEAYDKKALKINGGDLIELGYKEGREIGIILDYLLEQVMEDDSRNYKTYLIKLALSKFPL